MSRPRFAFCKFASFKFASFNRRLSVEQLQSPRPRGMPGKNYPSTILRLESLRRPDSLHQNAVLEAVCCQRPLHAGPHRQTQEDVGQRARTSPFLFLISMIRSCSNQRLARAEARCKWRVCLRFAGGCNLVFRATKRPKACAMALRISFSCLARAVTPWEELHDGLGTRYVSLRTHR